MFVDNCSAHPDVQLSHVKLVFLPLNTTSKLQPNCKNSLQEAPAATRPASAGHCRDRHSFSTGQVGQHPGCHCLVEVSVGDPGNRHHPEMLQEMRVSAWHWRYVSHEMSLICPIVLMQNCFIVLVYSPATWTAMRLRLECWLMTENRCSPRQTSVKTVSLKKRRMYLQWSVTDVSEDGVVEEEEDVPPVISDRRQWRRCRWRRGGCTSSDQWQTSVKTVSLTKRRMYLQWSVTDISEDGVVDEEEDVPPVISDRRQWRRCRWRRGGCTSSDQWQTSVKTVSLTKRRMYLQWSVTDISEDGVVDEEEDVPPVISDRRQWRRCHWRRGRCTSSDQWQTSVKTVSLTKRRMYLQWSVTDVSEDGVVDEEEDVPPVISDRRQWRRCRWRRGGCTSSDQWQTSVKTVSLTKRKMYLQWSVTDVSEDGVVDEEEDVPPVISDRRQWRRCRWRRGGCTSSDQWQTSVKTVSLKKRRMYLQWSVTDISEDGVVDEEEDVPPVISDRRQWRWCRWRRGGCTSSDQWIKRKSLFWTLCFKTQNSQRTGNWRLQYSHQVAWQIHSSWPLTWPMFSWFLEISMRYSSILDDNLLDNMNNGHVSPYDSRWNKNLSINTVVATGILPAAAVPPFPEFLSSGSTEQGCSVYQYLLQSGHMDSTRLGWWKTTGREAFFQIFFLYLPCWKLGVKYL